MIDEKIGNKKTPDRAGMNKKQPLPYRLGKAL
jgi:hypothetical protein